jgi:two-component system response regulator YesN
MTQLAEEIFNQYRLTVSIGIGNPYQTLRDISRSFDEAQQASEYAVYGGERRVVWYLDTARETSMYYYPIDTQQRLLNTLKVGEYDEAKRILDQILLKNFEERELSYDMRQQLIVELKGTMLKLMDQKSFQDEAFNESVRNEIAQIQPLDAVEQLRSRLDTLMRNICSAIAKQKSDDVDETIRAIMIHIQNQYTDPDLTLYRIAESVQRPERFISHLFKEQTGENLSDYLERIRMNKASDLLIQNELTIDEISAQVGYNSAHSFRRAFKRVKGVAPSAYRQTSE